MAVQGLRKKIPEDILLEHFLTQKPGQIRRYLVEAIKMLEPEVQRGRLIRNCK